MGGGGGGIQARVNRPFNEDYRCYSMVMLPGPRRENVDYGGKGKAPLKLMADYQ
jgi:hypothetical protein